MKIAGVQFHPQDKIYDFNLRSTDVKVGDVVIVGAKKGQDAGKVVYVKNVSEEEVISELPSVLRKATSSDLEKIKKHQEKEKEALKVCRKEIKECSVPMKLEGAHFGLSGSKITFYFTSEERIDFRELVKNLTRYFQKSIRLQQIGARDVTRKIGGYGMCGRELCCGKFLEEIKTISLDSARLQQMHRLGSERISGVCGRLMCCLAFEADLYEKLAKKMPNLNIKVKTPQGEGKVISRNILAQTVLVELDKEAKAEFPISEIKQRSNTI